MRYDNALSRPFASTELAAGFYGFNAKGAKKLHGKTQRSALAGPGRQREKGNKTKIK
jgi:hypothetical protein